ncbi:MAG: MotA/TolQ/ExbB proton channel family protein [Betaproteobacteria bacterium]|nr:MotA/TolQ/ExbB proton channel family protein [Betaproteobacteria bacterium]
MNLINRIPALLVAVVMAATPFAAAIVSLQSTQSFAQAPAADPAKPAADAAPAAEAAKSAPVAAPTVAKEMVTNPYGLEAMWRDGDFVTKATLIILGIMSMGSWYILIVKLFEQFKLMKDAKGAGDEFWAAGSLQQGVATLGEASAFRFIAESGLKASDHHSGLMAGVDLNEWVTMSIQRSTDNVNNRLQDGLAFLATVGSTAPFVGLFGTVWGIYHALTAIGIAGQASIDKVAGPVGEALIMTAFGLAVAVPAVLSYNWLIRRNKVSMEKVRAFSADLHSVLMSGGGKKK